MANEIIPIARKVRSIKDLWNYVMSKEKLERKIDAEFVEKLKDLPYAVAAKKMLGGANNINEPDWFICIEGRLLLIETKMKGKKPDTGQRIRGKWWARAGAKYIFCTTAEDMIQAVEDLKHEQEMLRDRRGEGFY